MRGLAGLAGRSFLAAPAALFIATALAPAGHADEPARRVIVICEELVEVGAIDPRLVTVPGLVVDLVVPHANAAHPTAVHQRYDYDRDHLTRYVAAAAAGGTTLNEYLRDHMLNSGPEDVSVGQV